MESMTKKSRVGTQDEEAAISGESNLAMDGDDYVMSDEAFSRNYCASERSVTVHGCCRNGTELVFSFAQNMDELCCMIWSSSVVLAEYVATELKQDCEGGCTILELGCGAAIPSLVAAWLGAKVVATDWDTSSVNDAIWRNSTTVAASKGSITLAHLPWGADIPEQSCSIVLVADAIYKEACLIPLASTLAALCAGSQVPRILMAYQRRDPKVEKLFFGPVLGKEALLYRDLSMDGLPQLSEDLREYVRLVEIYPKSG